MIAHVRTGNGYVSVSAAFHDPFGGALADPSTPTAVVSVVDAGTGALTPIAGSPFSLTKRASTTGYWGVSIPYNSLAAGIYEVFVSGTISATRVGTVVTFLLSSELAKVGDNLNIKISDLRRGNVKMTFSKAVADVPARNVAAGKLDSVTFITRAEGASDFTSPTNTLTLLARYATLGDDNPVSIGD